jgi:hypothetical protein
METDPPPGTNGFEVLEAMQATEPSQATAVLSKLSEDLHDKGADALDLTRAWAAFLKLLERRGYFTATPSQLAESLQEIKSIGAGFDLYDLAQSLARYDVVRTKCLHISGSRIVPELATFSSTCACTRHRKGKKDA